MEKRLRNKLHKESSSSRAVPHQLLKFLGDNIPGFKDEKYAFEIAWLLWCSTDPAREHRVYQGSIWMHTNEFRQLFGEVKNFTNANRGPARRYFSVMRHLNARKSIKDSYTNGYEPQPWMQKALEYVINSGEPIDFLNKRGRSRSIPSLAIRSTDTHGNVVRRWKDVGIPVLIPVNTEGLEVLLGKWEQILNLKSNQGAFKSTLEQYDFKEKGLIRAYRQTKIFIAEARASRHPGMLPIRYVMHESGRLYAEGLNLQSCKREIRQSALAGHWDVDISTCHLTIMAQMAKRFGQSCPALEDYIRQKTDHRLQLSRDLGISQKQAKKIITATGYGAPESTSPYNAIPKQIGIDKAEAFFCHPLYRNIKADVDVATKVILANHPVKNHSLINLANRAIPMASGKYHSSKDTTLMAHLLQGVEAAALEAAVRVCKGKVLLLQHDGFTATESIDPELLRAAVSAATGYDLTFEVEQIQIPMPKIELDPLFNKNLTKTRKPNIHQGFEAFWPVMSGTIAFPSAAVPPVFPIPLPPCLPLSEVPF